MASSVSRKLSGLAFCFVFFALYPLPFRRCALQRCSSKKGISVPENTSILYIIIYIIMKLII